MVTSRWRRTRCQGIHLEVVMPVCVGLCHRRTHGDRAMACASVDSGPPSRSVQDLCEAKLQRLLTRRCQLLGQRRRTGTHITGTVSRGAGPPFALTASESAQPELASWPHSNCSCQRAGRCWPGCKTAGTISKRTDCPTARLRPRRCARSSALLPTTAPHCRVRVLKWTCIEQCRRAWWLPMSSSGAAPLTELHR